jgi:hypothetical protein
VVGAALSAAAPVPAVYIPVHVQVGASFISQTTVLSRALLYRS